jgi:C4-dicarboxylate transporter, DctQ subunit
MWLHLTRSYDRLVAGLGLLAGFIFGAMALGIGVDVTLRNVHGSGVGWLIELLEYAMLVATLLAAPWVLREGAHVTVDILVSNLPAGARRLMRLLSSGAGLVICLTVLGYGWKSAALAFERGSMVYKSFVFPEWWVLALLPLCMGMLAIEFARLLWRTGRANAPDDGIRSNR